MAIEETEKPGYRKFLDQKVLARIGSLELRARLAVEGFMTGLHKSPYHGWSIEFAGHRSYVQGDDVRHVDWKVFGRTNKYYIKEYEEETNLNCMILLDCSESMAYRSPQAIMSKREYSASIAASLAYLALRQRDAVGLALFSDRITSFIKPSNRPGHWKSLVAELDHKGGNARTSIRSVLDDLSERLRHRTLVVLISDLFDDADDTLLGLQRLRYNRCEVIVCNVWDPAEVHFPLTGTLMFEGLEKSGELLTDPQSIRQAYLKEVQHFVTHLRRCCREMHIDYVQLETSWPLDFAIAAYLTTRSASMRRRSSRVLGRG